MLTFKFGNNVKTPVCRSVRYLPNIQYTTVINTKGKQSAEEATSTFVYFFC